MTTPYSKINTPLPEYELSVEGIRPDSIKPSIQPPNQQTKKGTDIANSLNTFETVLANLLESVGKFTPSVDLAQDLIEADRNLGQAIEELVLHQQACRRIENLEKESDKLNQQLNHILVELADCRRSLGSLPVVPDNNDDDFNKGMSTLTAASLLEYANKITKFTRAPPGYNPEMPEHANFPWPNEDELRKGVLSMSGSGAALNPVKESVVQESTDQPMAEPTTAKGQTQSSAETMARMSRRRSSAVSYGERPVVAPAAPPGKAILDLDLFDPDEEEDD